MTITAYIDPDSPDVISLNPDFAETEEIKYELMARNWISKKKRWIMPLEWNSCVNLRGVFGDRLLVDDTLSQWAHRELDMRVNSALALRDVDVPEKLPSKILNSPYVQSAVRLGEELGLLPHQVVGAAFMAVNRSCGIFDEMGTGKSAQSIAALRILNSQEFASVFPILVIAPSSAKESWRREFERWWPGLTVAVVEGTLTQRRKILQTQAHVLIIHWDILHKHSRLAKYGTIAMKKCVACGGDDDSVTETVCELHPKELNQIAFRSIIADEIHRITDPKTKVSRCLDYLTTHIPNRFALTGTPLQSNVEDIWPILRFISSLEFPARTRFEDRYVKSYEDHNGYRHYQGLREDTEPEYRRMTEHRTRRMLKAIVLPFLPPVSWKTRTVPMTGAQLKAYKEMQRDSIAELDDETAVETDPLIKAIRLLQFSSSCVEIVQPETSTEFEDDENDDAPEYRLSLPSNKISAFMEVLEHGDYGDSSLIVAAKSRQLLELLAGEMTRKGYKFGMITGKQSAAQKQQAMDDFQTGKIKYILLTIAAGGTAITLTAADTLVCLQREYSSRLMNQLYGRNHRIGSEIHSSITVEDYVSVDSIEEKQLELLKAKNVNIEKILRDRVLLRKLLGSDWKDLVDA